MIISTIRDINNNTYIAIDIELNMLDKNGISLFDMISIADDKITDFERCNMNLLERNSGSYHITIFNVMECGKYYIDKDIIGKTYNSNDLEYKGIGSISKDNNTTYFVVVESEAINANRTDMGLKKRDLHITIGFTQKDLFNERKTNTNVYSIKKI